MDNIEKQRLAIAGASILGIISLFLPWATVPLIGSLSGISTNAGAVLLVLAIACGAIALFGDRSKALKKRQTIIVAVLGALFALIAIMNIYSFNKEMGGASGEIVKGFFKNTKLEAGVYLAAISGLALVTTSAFMPLILKLMPKKLADKASKKVEKTDKEAKK